MRERVAAMWTAQEFWDFLTKPEAANGFTSLAAIITVISITVGGIIWVLTLIFKKQPETKSSQNITNEFEQRLQAIEKKNSIPHETLRKAYGKLAENTPNDQLIDAIEKWASELVSLREQLSKLSNDGAEAQALRTQALELLDQGELEKARALLAKANDSRRENRQARNREDANLLASQAEFENLLFHREKAISLLKEAVALDPANIETLVNLGDTLATLGQRQEAQSIFEKAHAQATEQDLPREESVCLKRIGDMLRNIDAKAALGFYQKSLAIAERLAGADETNLDYQRDLSVTYNKIGDMLANTDAKAALGFYQKDLTIAERLAGADETHLDYQRDLSVSYNKIGDMLRNIDAKAALGFYQKSLTIAERLAGADETHLGYQRDLSIAYRKLARIGQSPRENFGKAHDIVARLKKLGYLAPSDHWVVDETAHERDAATD